MNTNEIGEELKSKCECSEFIDKIYYNNYLNLVKKIRINSFNMVRVGIKYYTKHIIEVPEHLKLFVR